ncbi:Prolyl endopeptidase-like [Babesia bigemina]|uniref:Prolyl endopeptidase-like n=1 Tax=Babesia bigemina TaxID=5866 RepID=A0A061D2R4_BABBI|nr:Prolyl endopeptidase-like [Babesia bigemina]CDR95066.1 Prolyl endopeptidase-like [Babesia bigemina]|eukprot:XP_012767252.1 Prolyl endopeptidase-like [Babesia bigemina]
MRNPFSLYIRAFHHELCQTACCRRLFSGTSTGSQVRTVVYNTTIASYVRLMRQMDPPFTQTKQEWWTSQIEEGLMRGPRPAARRKREKGDAVATALDNYEWALEENRRDFERVSDVVRREAAKITDGMQEKLEYEVIGDHAYFVVNSSAFNHEGGRGQAGGVVEDEDRVCLVRAGLPNRRGMNRKRQPRGQPSEADEPYIIGRQQGVLDFGNIVDGRGNLVSNIRSMRVGQTRHPNAVLALVHDASNPDMGKEVHFVAINCVKKKGYHPKGGAKIRNVPKVLPDYLTGVDELHFLPRGGARDRHCARVFYTLVNEQERAWQLRVAYVCTSNGKITNDRPVYTERDPTKYVAIHKTKDGRMLIVAALSHGRTFETFCIKANATPKLYRVPLASDTKAFLEHRQNHLYAVRHVTVNDTGDMESRASLNYRKFASMDNVKAQGIDSSRYDGGCVHGKNQWHTHDTSLLWAVSKMDDRALIPNFKRSKRVEAVAARACGEIYRGGSGRWKTVATFDHRVVADIDMMYRGLVIYAMAPPSTPTILVMPFCALKSRGKGIDGRGNRNGLCEVDLPLRVGAIEPQGNSNFGATKVAIVINAPGTRDIKCYLDLDVVREASSKTDPRRGNGDSETKAASRVTEARSRNPTFQGAELRNNVVRSSLQTLTCVGDVPSTHHHVCHVATRDGTCRVPVTLIKKASNTQTRFAAADSVLSSFQNTGNKCVVYVYGAYGQCLQVNNDVEHNVLLALGYTLCFAHVRGGGEMGNSWHVDATKSEKHRGITDLADVLEFLLAKSIAQRNKLAIATTSAGGVLGGCIYNMLPGLCSCVLLKLPFLDVLDAIADPSKPLTQLELEEFGGMDDISVDEVYSYNPCSNARTKAGAKPALVIQCNAEDARAPWRHSAGFVALNGRHCSNIFMKITHGSHVDGSSQEERLQLIAERVQILEQQLGEEGRLACRGAAEISDYL